MQPILQGREAQILPTKHNLITIVIRMAKGFTLFNLLWFSLQKLNFTIILTITLLFGNRINIHFRFVRILCEHAVPSCHMYMVDVKTNLHT